MRGIALQDRIARGLGTAARHIGTPHDVFRPRGAAHPLAPGNRVIRLGAAFNAGDGKFRKPQLAAEPQWWGVFDTAYVRPGDYLCGEGGIFFVAALQPLLPVLCTRTNRRVGLARPGGAALVGSNSYGGVQPATATALLTGWPASLLQQGRGQQGPLPGDTRLAFWTVLLPRLPVAPKPGDLLEDDLGQTYVLAAAEESDLGWQLQVKQVAS